MKKPKQKRKRRVPDRDRKQRQIVVRITEAEHAALESIAQREDLPVSYFIREGIKLVIEREAK